MLKNDFKRQDRFQAMGFGEVLETAVKVWKYGLNPKPFIIDREGKFAKIHARKPY